MNRLDTENTNQPRPDADYLGAIIDENGRETPISNAMIENSLQKIQDTSAEFICRLAKHVAN
jgi:hypothetical protein